MMLPPVLAHIESLGLEVYTSGDYNLNLFGIRSPDILSGTFNDLLGCAYKADSQWHVRYWAATCDPGVFYRENPMNVDGTAILMPGQYKGVYKIDGHGRTRYKALCQRNGTVRVWRDNNKDDVLDQNVEVAEGWYGINIHASSTKPYDEDRDRDPDASPVNRWSAGCQVHATTTGFREMMALAHKQIEAHPTWEPSFTYTLLDDFVT